MRNKLTWRTFRSIFVFLVLALIVTGFSAKSSNFLNQANIVNILRMAVPILLICSGVTLIMVAAQIDL